MTFTKILPNNIKSLLTVFLVFVSLSSDSFSSESIFNGFWGDSLKIKEISNSKISIDGVSIERPTDKPLTLKGHKFLINSNLESPFIESYIQTNMGVAQTVDIEIPPIVIDSQEVVQLKGELFYTNLKLEFQQAIRDWMAFRVNFGIFGRAGTEGGTLLSQGVNLSIGYELGWLFNLYRSKDFLLSGSLNVYNNSITLIDIKDFAQEIIDSGRITASNKFIKTVPSLKAGTTISSAYTINKSFGVLGNVSINYGETVDRSAKNKWFVNYGGAVDYDLLPKNSVPIGFLVGFYHRGLPITTDELISEPNNILFQINYTGRKDLNLGLEGNYQFYKPEGFENSIKFLVMNLNLTYFF